MCWKRSPAVKESVEPPPPAPEEEEKAWDELEKESQRLTYEDLLRQEGPDAPARSDAKEAKKKETAHTSVLGQPLQCRLSSGFLHLAVAPAQSWPNPPLHPDRHHRLPEPHETGMLAGALYAICPGSVTDLQFNFVEEQYDCTVRASGRLYPAVLLLFTAAFAASRPVRRLWAEWHAVNKEEQHG